MIFVNICCNKIYFLYFFQKCSRQSLNLCTGSGNTLLGTWVTVGGQIAFQNSNFSLQIPLCRQKGWWGQDCYLPSRLLLIFQTKQHLVNDEMMKLGELDWSIYLHKKTYAHIKICVINLIHICTAWLLWTHMKLLVAKMSI